VLLSQLFKGDESYETPENLQLYRELVVEANTQLGYFTMPDEIFGKYKEIVKMTTYDSLKEQLGEDPRKHYKRQQVLLENESNRNIYTQLPDGRVPSFEEFKAIKDKITRTNEGLGSSLSPLKLNDKNAEEMRQYLQLEQLAQDYPKARERITNLQKNL
jgi:hypothetical protein